MKNIKMLAIIMAVLVLVLVGGYMLRNPLYQGGTRNAMNTPEKVENQNSVENSREEKVGNKVENAAMDEKNAFNFTLNDVNGVSHSLSDYRGKKVYLKYWASWCPICLGGMGEFEQLVKNNADSENIVILSVVSPSAFGEKTVVGFGKWYKEQGYDIPVLLDERGVLARKIGVRAFPTSVYIDSSGAIQAIAPGEASNEMIIKKLATFQ